MPPGYSSVHIHKKSVIRDFLSFYFIFVEHIIRKVIYIIISYQYLSLKLLRRYIQ